MKSLLMLMLVTTICLSACKTVPHVAQPWPQLPVLEAPAPEPSFIERMDSFLQGKLPEQSK
ncbi:hypothetical protein WT58_23895 [Burkholderia territorii]|nr:hypothetical protein WT58_23895 [Burkholderia territorii]